MADETPRRRAADRDRRRWNDDRLDDLATQVRALGPSVGQLIGVEARLAQVTDDADDFKRWIGDVEARLRVDLQREREDRREAEERQKAYAERIEKACATWAQKLDEALPRLTVIESKQEREEDDDSHRRSLLYGVAGAFTATALGVIAHLLHLL